VERRGLETKTSTEEFGREREATSRDGGCSKLERWLEVHGKCAVLLKVPILLPAIIDLGASQDSLCGDGKRKMESVFKLAGSNRSPSE
jgi:hypothetical protein